VKDKISEIETTYKNKNIRDLYSGISGFKKGYQPRFNIIKDASRSTECFEYVEIFL
jgi:hypothetical protein